MKKNFIGIFFAIVAIIAVALIVLMLNYKKGISKPEVSDAAKFKDEYVSLNGQTNSSNKTYPQVTISDNNKFHYATETEILDILNGQTGVIYFGFPTCPWCRNMVSVLDEVSLSYSTDKIYYYNIKDIRSTITVNDNNELETKKGTDFYYQLLEKLDSSLEDYTITDKKDKTIKTGEKRLYAPTVIFIKNGEVVDFVEGTVDSQKDPYVALTETQRNELISKYQEGFNKLGDICDEKC